MENLHIYLLSSVSVISVIVFVWYSITKGKIYHTPTSNSGCCKKFHCINKQKCINSGIFNEIINDSDLNEYTNSKKTKKILENVNKSITQSHIFKS